MFTGGNCDENLAPLHLDAAFATGDFCDDAQTSVGSEPTAPPLNVDRDGTDDEDKDAQNAWSLHVAERNRCSTPQIALTSDDLPSERQTDVADLSSSFPALGLNSRPADWTWCPELDHRAVVQFKTMMRKKGLSPAQPPRCHIDAASPPSCSAARCETPLLDSRPGGGCSSVSTVTLRRRADQSFGINVEMTSHPLKVVITRLNPGGAAGRVRVHLFASWQPVGHWKASHLFLFFF